MKFGPISAPFNREPLLNLPGGGPKAESRSVQSQWEYRTASGNDGDREPGVLCFVPSLCTLTSGWVLGTAGPGADVSPPFAFPSPHGPGDSEYNLGVLGACVYFADKRPPWRSLLVDRWVAFCCRIFQFSHWPGGWCSSQIAPWAKETGTIRGGETGGT